MMNHIEFFATRRSGDTFMDISRKSRIFYKAMMVNNLVNRGPSLKGLGASRLLCRTVFMTGMRILNLLAPVFDEYR